MIGRKGQGSLEYILLIGGAVLVAVIVVALVTQGVSTSGSSTADVTEKNAFCGRQVTCGTCLNVAAGTAPLDSGQSCKPVFADGTVAATDTECNNKLDADVAFVRCTFQ